ncbi:MAG: hypothetical protein WD766_04735 [Gemmatimonadota bacterium]
MKFTAPLLCWLLLGCASAPAPVVAPPIEEPIPAFPSSIVWTARAGVGLYDGRSRSVALENPFTPLETIGRDTVGLRARCAICEPEIEGYVDEGSVIYTPLAPEIAAWGTVGEFALAIRDATERRDLDSLRGVMAFDFTFSLVGVQNPDAAFAVWTSEEFTSLDEVPSLLSNGLATLDGRIWSAPVAFVENLHHRGLRLGFRRGDDGRWEWLYLIRGVG